MATIRQLPRAATVSVDLITIPIGALYVDTDRFELRLGDGVTPGGIRIPSIDQLNNLFLLIGEGLGSQVGFPTSGVGFLTRLANNTFAVRTLEAGAGLTLVNPIGSVANPKYTVDTQWVLDLITSRVAAQAAVQSGTPGLLLGTTATFGANAYAAMTDAATIAVDFNLGWNKKVTISADRILGFPTNIKIQSGIIAVKSDAVSAHLLTLAAGWKDPLSLFPVLIPANQRAMINYFVSDLSEVVISGMLILP